jgi:hypothetical protein
MKDKEENIAQITSEDYYFDKSGLMVFKEEYHLKRGYCCKNGCKHCPYGFKKK